MLFLWTLVFTRLDREFSQTELLLPPVPVHAAHLGVCAEQDTAFQLDFVISTCVLNKGSFLSLGISGPQKRQGSFFF